MLAGVDFRESNPHFRGCGVQREGREPPGVLVLGLNLARGRDVRVRGVYTPGFA